MKINSRWVLLATALACAPLALQTGCAVMHGQEGVKAYAKDDAITARIKTAMYADPAVKGTQVKVQSLNGVVELSGFVNSEQAKERAGQIAESTPGVVKVYNNLLLPTGRSQTPSAQNPATEWSNQPQTSAPVTK